MSTRITEVSIADTQWVRVAEFDEDWPLSITVKYEKPDPLSMGDLSLPRFTAPAAAEPS